MKKERSISRREQRLINILDKHGFIVMSKVDWEEYLCRRDNARANRIEKYDRLEAELKTLEDSFK